MAYIDKIQQSGITYEIKDSGALRPDTLSSVTYTKDELDFLLNDKMDDGDAYTKEEMDAALSGLVTSGDVYDELTAYTYDKETIDNKVASGGTFDPTRYYTIPQVNNLLDYKADSATTYTKTEVDGLLANKANTGVSYTKAESDAKYISANTLDNYYKKSETSGKTEISTALNGKSNTGHTHQVADITNFANQKLLSGATQGYTVSVLTQEQWASISGNPNPNYIYLIKE